MPAATARRHNFLRSTRERVAGEVGYRCSLQDCGAFTIGPDSTSRKGFSSSGVAAHITAAAPGGPRFDRSLTPAERASPDNAIWCCANHARIVDNDHAAFTTEGLRRHKREAIDLARRSHSTGDVDPNGRIKLRRRDQNDAARHVLTTAVQCRLAIVRGIARAGEARQITSVDVLDETRRFHLIATDWPARVAAVIELFEDSLVAIRIHWRSPDRTMLGSLTKLGSRVLVWAARFDECASLLMRDGHGARSPEPRHEAWSWDAIFDGSDADMQTMLGAVSADVDVVERWADPFIVSRDM